jgi:ABC-2 type transport system permease protein
LDAGNFQPPLQVRIRVWYNPDLVSSHFMIPGVIGMILYAITSILTATAVVRERERGTIEQLIVTPIRPWELVVGKILPYAILAFINTLEVLAIGGLGCRCAVTSVLSWPVRGCWSFPGSG